MSFDNAWSLKNKKDRNNDKNQVYKEVLENGWFFQPLGCLIDSAIIKILGDYKLLYESERRWGKLSLGITALGIGCFLDDDHDFDTLMGTVVIGCAALFLLSLSTTVQPADPLLLGLHSEEYPSMETSPLLTKPPLLPQYYVNNNNNNTSDSINSQQAQRLYIHHHYHHFHHHYYHHHHHLHQSAEYDGQMDYSRSPQNADLNITKNGAPLLLDSAATTISSSPYYYTAYKPYSLFGDHLSHISEEDITMLQQTPPTPPRASSITSNMTNSMDFLLDNSTFQFTPISYSLPTASSSSSTPALSSPQTPSPFDHSTLPLPALMIDSAYLKPGRYDDDHKRRRSRSDPFTSNSVTITPSLTDSAAFMSMSLALLPYPPGDIPMIVLITVFPRFRPTFFQQEQQQQQQQQQQHQQQLSPSLMDWHLGKYDDDDDDEKQTHLLIMSNCFIMGLVYAPMILWAPLIYYDYYTLPMHSVGLMVLIGCLSDMVTTHCVPLVLEHYSLRNGVLLAHLVLMLCIFIYACLPCHQEQHWWSLFCLFALHITQSSCIHTIWLMASYQVDYFFLSHCQDRMMLRGKMSALYSSFGPAFGSLVVGWLATLQWSFQSIYLFTLLLIPLSASMALGWC
ncbi:hypothetical protein BC941DRAFT_497545 [Chlamydoabsidia padenii]|nr:hypothetical protein BC941DRAFT_497545 [Chlamydoabsidia padenii]